MKILERNYQNSIQSYIVCNNDDEAKKLIRWNLLSRLSKIVGTEINEEEKSELLIPNIEIHITRLKNLEEDSDKSLFLGGLTVPKMNFEKSRNSLSPEIQNTFKSSGVDLPTSDFLDKKLDRVYSNGIFNKDPFNLSNLEVEELELIKVNETEYSSVDSVRETEYANIQSSHFKTLKAVGLLALHKHVTEYPKSPKQRLILGVDNLVRDVEDPKERKELKDYLLEYVNNPSSRALSVKESELVIKQRSDSAVTIPTWVIITTVSLVLLGTIAYSQKDRIKEAWETSKDMSKPGVNKTGPSFSQKKSFFKNFFTPKGRSMARDYMNNKAIYKESNDTLNNIDFVKRAAELARDKAEFRMKSLTNKYYKND